MLQFLKDYPEIGSLCIATFFTAIGFFGKTLIELLLDKRRKKAELRELFWKEKIQAAKKASEFYYEHLSFLNILSQQIEVEINEKENSEALASSFQKQIINLSNKITNPTHYEHHHINIFYDFDEKELHELNMNSFEIIQDIQAIQFLEDDSIEVINENLELVKKYSKKLKLNYEKSIAIYRKYLKLIRKDITKFVE